MATYPDLLRKFSCFRDLSEDQVNAIAQITDAVCYLPNHVLFNEGEAGKCLFFLVKGEVEILYNIGEEGMVRVDTVSSEEIVGCSAMIEPYTYTATGRCLTEVEVLEINITSLQELMQKDCPLGLKLQQHIIKVLMRQILELRLELPAH